MFAGEIDRTVGVREVLHQHVDAPGEIRIDVLQRLLDLVARRPGDADAAHIRRRAEPRSEVAKDLLDGLYRVARVAVGAHPEDGAGVGSRQDCLGHRRADVEREMEGACVTDAVGSGEIGLSQVAVFGLVAALQFGHRGVLVDR